MYENEKMGVYFNIPIYSMQIYISMITNVNIFIIFPSVPRVLISSVPAGVSRRIITLSDGSGFTTVKYTVSLDGSRKPLLCAFFYFFTL